VGQFNEPQQRAIDRAINEWRGRPAYARGYPQSRQRAVQNPIASTVAEVVSGAATQSAALQQTLLGGGFAAQFFTVNAATTTVQAVGAAIPRPFIVTSIFSLTDRPITDVSLLFTKISDDNNTTGGRATSGVNIGLEGLATTAFVLGNVYQIIYPMYRHDHAPAYIKFVIVNSSGASAINAWVGITYMYS